MNEGKLSVNLLVALVRHIIWFEHDETLQDVENICVKHKP